MLFLQKKKKKNSFFEKLTGAMRASEENDVEELEDSNENEKKTSKKPVGWMEEENEEMELAVDVYQTPTDIILETMVAGVRPEDLEITIARDLITIKGKRESGQNIDDENYFTKELYWGKFSRTVLLPQEVEPEEVEAVEKHGLLTIKIKKVDKDKKNSIRVKSV